MNISFDENISAYLKRTIVSFKAEPEIYNYGTVTSVGDGVVKAKGLSSCRFGELLEFEGEIYGMAMELEEGGVGAVLLNNSDNVSVGSYVRGTGRICSVPVGYPLIGRVIDSIGRPLDNIPLVSNVFYPVERPAPDLMDRRPVDSPLETGIIAVDSMIPIGKGQRELIIGDRQTGKTTIAVDTILNQKGKNVICIYCAIGQKASTVSQLIENLKKNDAMKYSIIVASTASDSPAMQYLAPYAACSVGEYFMERGKDVLIIYDDLSKHAVSYRAISLLLHRPPGREAYPGDIFYLHSRLLERAACLSHEKGGGSLTALPIVETTGGNISSYIPTNIISITDGQIYLETELFHSGIRPAINVGLSVSRVGRAAQQKAMRQVSSSLRIKLAQYREMAVFSRFGSDLDETTKVMLESGERLTKLFIQNKGRNFSLAEMVAVLYSYNRGIFEKIPSAQINDSMENMLSYLSRNESELLNKINSTGDLDMDTSDALESALLNWCQRYTEGE